MNCKDKPKHNREKYQEFRENLEQLAIEYFEHLTISDIIVGLIYEAVDCALSDDRSDKSIIALMEILSESMSDWIVNDQMINEAKKKHPILEALEASIEKEQKTLKQNK